MDIRDKGAKIYVLLLILILFGFFVSLGVGAVSVPLSKIFNIILSRIPVLGDKLVPDWSASQEVIILKLRLPRIILAFLTGAELSLAGVIYQGIFRNPLADPYIIGASSGASLGAALAILLFPGIKILGLGPIPLFAFLGALLTVIIVYVIAGIGGRVSSNTLLLAGIAVSSFISALVSFLMYFSDQKLHQIYFWLLGSFSSQGWKEVYINLPYGALGFLLGMYNLRALNIFQLGEDTAFFTGVDIELLKKLNLAAASLLTASAVSVSGVIGFVGLIIPHVMRMIVGPDHRKLYPMSAMAGGLYLMIADTISRIIIAPTELPVGILTALFGGPFFLYLLLRKSKKDYRL
ncbi:MAG: iron ABC transporter permease [Thermosediminibacteraceae bacterium]|nr:iron ABC transporter permease [Thermosediminibacteraceae bacterium]